MSQRANARSSELTANAQVGEWLKPADCKSAPPRRYEGSNPSLCTRFFARDWQVEFLAKRLVLALAAYVALAAFAFSTFPGQRVWGGITASLAMFVRKTLVARRRVMELG